MGNLTIKGVTTRKEFEFATESVVLTGSYEQDGESGKLQQLSANVSDSQGTARGTVRGYLRGGQMLYDYNGMSSAQTAEVAEAVTEIENNVNGNGEGGEA